MKIQERGFESETIEFKGKGFNNKQIAEVLSNKYETEISTRDVTDFFREYNNIMLSQTSANKYSDKIVNSSMDTQGKLNRMSDILMEKIEEIQSDTRFKLLPRFSIALCKVIELKAKLNGDLDSKEQADFTVKIASMFEKKKKKKEDVQA